MKTMTCKQLGGACDVAFQADSFDELMQQSKLHGMAMFQQQDVQHMAAIQQAMMLMADPAAMQAWMDEKRNEFDALPED
jgi:predicted small metal-binding protein